MFQEFPGNEPETWNVKLETMIASIQHYIDTHSLLPAAGGVLVGVSGGVDSMVLLHVLHALGYNVQVAHVNYRMRGAASDSDQLLVETYCGDRQIPCFVHQVDNAFLEAAKAGSFQQAARDERYAFFQRTATSQRLSRVAVAHHLDDQVETGLMYLMRGSGIEGLAGMSPSRHLDQLGLMHLVRPMLDVTRVEVREFAESAGVPWREDASNAHRTYLRNKIRHELVAPIREIFGEGSVQNVARSAGMLRGYVAASFQPELYARFESVVMPKQGLFIERMQRAPKIWQHRLILEALHRWTPTIKVTSRHAEAICKLMDAQVGRRVVFDDVVVWREREVLRFLNTAAAPSSENECTDYLVSPGNVVALGEGTLDCRIKYLPDIEGFKCGPQLILADASKLQFPLTLRRWRAGDSFIPFGMQGHKKISDFLTDIKLPSHERDTVMVLASAGKIVWVVGHRASAGFEVGPDTVEIFEGEFRTSQTPLR